MTDEAPGLSAVQSDHHEVTASRSSLRPPAPLRLSDVTFLRYGVRPLFLAVDLLALGVGVLTVAGVAYLDLLFALLVLGTFQTAGLYRSRLSLSVLDDLPSLLARVVAATTVTSAVGLAVDAGDTSRPFVLAAAVAVAVVVLRTLAYVLVRRFRARGVVAHPTLILGAGRIGGQLAEVLLEHPEYGLRPVGFIDADPFLPAEQRAVPVLGAHGALAQVIVEFGVRDVVVAFGSAPESQMVDVIRTCDRLECEIFFVPRLFELHHTLKGMDEVWGIPLVRLRRSAHRSPTWALKRAMDCLLALVAVLVLSPVLVACAVAVRLEGGPGILFRQERVGLDGRPFQVLKFRSLRPVDDGESETRWNISQDDRVGRVGKFLRRSSLDELPQLFNIVVGQMSIVGPRPERPHFVDQFTRAFPRYTARHRVPAGLTGWAQVHGLRGDTSIEDRARFDNHYIENWSLWGDLKIMLRTLSSLMRGSG